MTFAQLSAVLEPINWQRSVVGFDTFSRFKKLSDADSKISKSEFMKEDGLNVNSYRNLESCISLYDQNRFLSHLPKVHLIKGDVRKTIPQFLEEYPHTVISLLYLDFDVFGPTQIALEYFLPRMPKGATVAFDELNAYNWLGETLAVKDTFGIRNFRIERFQFDTPTSCSVPE